jgi:hypothetical protein
MLDSLLLDGLTSAWDDSRIGEVARLPGSVLLVQACDSSLSLSDSPFIVRKEQAVPSTQHRRHPAEVTSSQRLFLDLQAEHFERSQDCEAANSQEI